MKPILFNIEMVQAILDGRKTVTRRKIKGLDTCAKFFGWQTNTGNDSSYGVCTFIIDNKFIGYKPKYLIGDILYVQETWKIDSIAPHLSQMLIDFKAIKEGFSHSEVFTYFAKERFSKFKKFYQKNGWQSPYFMPKEAARLFLRVTDVRIERLHDITLLDVLKEGLRIEKYVYTPLIKRFSNLWDTTIDKKELNWYGWNANPYVFVYEFEVISKEEAEKKLEEMKE